MKSLSAIILAAGKGTRMKSNRAKVTFPIAGKAMVQRVVETASKAGCESICVVVGHQKESVIACLEDNKRLQFAEQNEQLGTGHAVMMAEPLFTDPDQDVLILSGDVPLLSAETLVNMRQDHQATGSVCTVLTAWLDDPGKYGRIIRDTSGQISSIVEYKDATDVQRSIREWNTGIYCFRCGDLFSALKRISNANNQREYYLTDVVSILNAEGRKVTGVVLENLVEVAGVNSQEQLADLEDQFVDSIRKHWLNNGVVIHNPRTVFISDEVVLEPDVEIHQNCVIKGKSQVCSGAYLGPGCYVENSHLSDNALLEGHNVLVDAHIPEGHILEFGEQVIEETYHE